MTQVCSLTPSIANESVCLHHKRLPKGIHITETDHTSGSGIEEVSQSQPFTEEKNIDHRPWGYLMIHNKQVEQFRQQIEAYNHAHPDDAHPIFIHYSYKYKQKSNGRGVIKQQLPTVSGLVFLQGETQDLQQFLRTNYPLTHLINNCSTGRPASIPHSVMRPFMEVVTSHPEAVTFLRDPFEKFARDHVRLRVLTGLFAGLEGYVVRIDRDRQLIMDFAGYAVAIRGVHKEDFRVVE